MSELMLFNPRKKRRAKHALATNPRKKHVLRKNPGPGRRHRALRKNPRRLRRNPINLRGAGGFVSQTLMPAGVGAVGALGMDIAIGLLPLPASIKTGAMRPIVRLAGAVGIGMIASMVAGKRTGGQVLAGAVTVTLYDLLRGLAQKSMPTIPLGDVEAYETVEYSPVPNQQLQELIDQSQQSTMAEYGDSDMSAYEEVGEYSY